MVGEFNRSFDYPKEPEDTIADLERAFAALGTVLDVSRVTMTVTGQTRYGLQRVRLRTAVLQRPGGGSTVQVQGFGDDIWGGGARRGTDKLLRALEDG